MSDPEKHIKTMRTALGRARWGGPAAILGALGLYAATHSFYSVEAGRRAVLFSRIGGLQNNVYSEGLHFRIPWLQWPILFDIRTRPFNIKSPTGSKDLQTINIALRVLYRPHSAAIPVICRQLGEQYDERVLPSITNEVLKSVVAKFNASQLITMRQEVSLLIAKELKERAKDFNLILDDVSITELGFGKEYTHAVEAKQIAQQEAQRAQFVVERAKQERQEKVVRAEGEAKAAELIGESVRKNPGYLKLRRIRAATAISKVIAESSNRAYLDSGTLLLNLNDLEDQFNKPPGGGK